MILHFAVTLGHEVSESEREKEQNEKAFEMTFSVTNEVPVDECWVERSEEKLFSLN